MVAASPQDPSAGTRSAPSFEPHPPSSEAELDRVLSRLKENQRAFARARPAQKAAWLRELQARFADTAEEWVRAACGAKQIPFDQPVAGEEWLAGPALTVRNCRLLASALDAIAAGGKPPLDSKRILEAPHGGLSVGLMPYDTFDTVLYGGMTGETWLAPGIHRGDIPANQATFYDKRDPEGGVSLILGAGNVASIPPMDALYKLFVEGQVCVIKMNPVNEYLGPLFERACRPLIDAGYLAIVYGGAEVGSTLCYHDAVDDVHITGSDKTHDLIVWGPPGPERDRRKRDNDPLLRKRITSELGNISPVLVVPGPYTNEELSSMAENLAGMVTNNGSFNCNAAKLLVLPRGWSHRETLLQRIGDVLSRVPPRNAYYPGAFDRYDQLTRDRSDVRKFGSAAPHQLPWTLLPGLEPNDESERNFITEPFCAILSEVAVGSEDPKDFLAAAVPFANDRVWGTLNSMLFVHPATEADAGLRASVNHAIAALRHGTVGVNVWPAAGYAFVTTPWGGHPSATLQDIQSGLGWVHNTTMLENIEKSVVRGPLKPFPKGTYFPTHKTFHTLARRLVAFEAAPSWLKVPGLAMAAMKG